MRKMSVASQSPESKRKRYSHRKGMKLPPEHVQKIKDSANRIPVVCISTGELFNSAREAADSKGLRANHITHCCRGKRKTHGGFEWSYAA